MFSALHSPISTLAKSSLLFQSRWKLELKRWLSISPTDDDWVNHVIESSSTETSPLAQFVHAEQNAPSS